MEATHGDYDIDTVPHIDTLRSEIKRMYDSDNPVDILADLLMNGHDGSAGYLTFGNNKVSKNTGIFNMNSATDCPNADTSEDNQSATGVCQVPWSDCYAHVSENVFKGALPKRRRQEYLWDCVSPDMFAAALLQVKDRKRSPFKNLRVSESGDFRHNGDIMAWERIAQLVDGHINVYTYSASHKLSAWDNVNYLVVNQSNDFADYGVRRFKASFDGTKADDSVWCPYSLQQEAGVPNDERTKCGDCLICVTGDMDKDVTVHAH